jgi:outer membrane protein TolC
MFFASLSVMCFSQNTLTLEDCFGIAEKNSLEIQQTKNDLQQAEYNYKFYKRQYTPSLYFGGTIPAFNRSISKITLPDGTEAFVSQSVGSYSGTLSLTQPLPWTSGEIYLSTGLQRLDLYTDNKTTSYLATPINIGLRQPLFGYNAYRWDRKIEPLKYREAQQKCIEQTEILNEKVVTAYFDCLVAQRDLYISKTNLANADTLFDIMTQRYQAGKITEDELLQVEVSKLNYELAVAEKENTLKSNFDILYNILRTEKNKTISLQEPANLKLNYIDSEEAYRKAEGNGMITLTHQRQMLEAESNYDRIKKSNGISLELNGTLGLSKTDKSIPDVYNGLLNQEVVTLSLNIPIVDFGKKKYQRKAAEITKINTELSIEQQKQDNRQAIEKLVNDFNTKALQVNTLEKTKDLNDKRYYITKERFISGKINFLEYSNAEQQKANSELEYLKLLQTIYQSYYQIRQVTLFDWQQNQMIKKEIPLN